KLIDLSPTAINYVGCAEVGGVGRGDRFRRRKESARCVTAESLCERAANEVRIGSNAELHAGGSIASHASANELADGGGVFVVEIRELVAVGVRVVPGSRVVNIFMDVLERNVAIP